MAISRTRKEELYQEYTEQYQKSNGIMLAHYRNLTVAQMQAMRRRAREQGGQIFVVKNTLLRNILEEHGVKTLTDMMTGPTLAVFCHKGIQPLSKLFNEFAKDFEEGQFTVRGAVLEGRMYNAEEAVRLADMPSREQLLAQVLGTINAPASQVVGVVASGVRQILNVLQAYVDKLEGGAPAEAAA